MGEKPTEASEQAMTPVATIAEAPPSSTAIAPAEPEPVPAIEAVEEIPIVAEEERPVLVEETPVAAEEHPAVPEERPVARQETPAGAEEPGSPLADVNVSVDPETGRTSVKFSYICLHCGAPRDVDSGRYLGDCPTCGQTAESGNNQLDAVARGEHIPAFDRSSSFYP